MKPGDTLVMRMDPMTTARIVMYAGASGDFNPIHYDEAAARSAGLGGVIAHGLLTLGFAARLAGEQCRERGWVKAVGGRFLSPVRPGDVIELRATVGASPGPEGAPGDLRLEIEGAVQERPVLRGYAVVAGLQATRQAHG